MNSAPNGQTVGEGRGETKVEAGRVRNTEEKEEQRSSSVEREGTAEKEGDKEEERPAEEKGDTEE